MNQMHENNVRSEQVERELLTVYFGERNNLAVPIQMLSPNDFMFFGKQYELAVECFEKGKDPLYEFTIKGFNVSDFLGYVPRRDMRRVCEDILTYANARRVAKTISDYHNQVPSEDVDKFVNEIQKKLIESVSTKAHESGDISNVLTEYKKLQEFYKEKIQKGGIVGLSTGYNKIDEIIDGFRPEHLWVIGGYTNMGKTSAALNLVANMVKQGKRVVFYSLEMSKTDIISRLLGIMTEDNGLSIVKGYAKFPQEVERCMKLLEESQMTIYCGKNELSEIQMSMYEEQLKKPVDLFVVDFLQIVTVKGSKSEYEMITNSSLGFQQMAKKLKVPIILLSQISNDGAKNHDQDVMTFKGSGSIASAADFAIEIVKGEENKADWLANMQQGLPVKMVWKIRKNRHGRVGFIDMKFNGKNGTFKIDTELEDFTK